MGIHHRYPVLRTSGIRLARGLAGATSNELVVKALEAADGYVNFLVGKGAGSGWNLMSEIDAASATIATSAPVLFDIGANVGEWTVAMCERFPDAHVVMFEPSAACIERLHNLTSSSRGAREVVAAAVGEEPGTLTLYSSGDLDQTASLHERGDSYFQQQRYTSSDVRVVTVDQEVRRLGLDHIDFMKMDIEGHELFALQGAEETFRRGAVAALSFEFGSGNINSRTYFRDFWQFFQRHEYDVFRVGANGSAIPITTYSEDLEYFRGVSNYVATRRSVASRG